MFQSVKIQAEIENLHEELEKQADTQKNLMVERERELLKTEEKLTEETTQLKEKASMIRRKQGLLPSFPFQDKEHLSTKLLPIIY